MDRQFIEGTWQNDRSFSRAVVTEGGKTIWLAGHGVSLDEAGDPMPFDFATQTQRSFEYLAETLELAGGSLADMVTMTVYICDTRFGNEFVEIRKEYYPDGNYPGSALITVAGFAKPNMMVEIQGMAVIDG